MHVHVCFTTVVHQCTTDNSGQPYSLLVTSHLSKQLQKSQNIGTEEHKHTAMPLAEALTWILARSLDSRCTSNPCLADISLAACKPDSKLCHNQLLMSKDPRRGGT